MRTSERESKRTSDTVRNRPDLSLRGRVENQAQLGLVCEHTLRVNRDSNGQESPLCLVALSMSHRVIFYDT